MVETGEASGTRTVALLTQMDEPLGRFAGNWVEVLECVDIMQGTRGIRNLADLIELTNILSGWMLHLAAQARSPEAGDLLATSSSPPAQPTAPGSKSSQPRAATPHLRASRAFHQPNASRSSSPRDRAAILAPWTAPKSAGPCSVWAPAALKPGDPVSAHAGIEVHAKTRRTRPAGQPLLTLFAEDESLLAEPLEMLRATYQIATSRPADKPLVRDIIAA